MPQIKGTAAFPAKHGGTITRNATGSWTLRYWLDGRQRERTFRDTPGKPGSGRKLAEDFSLKLATGKREGDVTFAAQSRAAIPFVDYCEQWIAGRRECTSHYYRAVLKRIVGELGNKTLAQVAGDRELAQRLIDESPGSYKRRTRIVLVSPCNEAVKAGRLSSHRLRGLRVEEDNRPAEIAWASRESLDLLASELGPYGLAVWTGRLCGLRLGESLGLRKGDFIEGGTVLRLTRTCLADGTTGPLKARHEGDYRDIPVPPALWAVVKDAPVYDGDNLFPPCYQSTVHQRVRHARDKCGLAGKFTMHDLRHMFASDMLAAGIPILEVSRYLGHKSITVTANVYGHLVPSAFGRAREVFASW